MDYLFVIDMQNDFITGKLANEEAGKNVDGIADLITHFKGKIIATRDTHTFVEDSVELKTLPKHCIKYTDGWLICKEIFNAMSERGFGGLFLDKTSFRIPDSDIYWIGCEDSDTFYVVGTCTDICVLSNAIALRTMFPNANVIVYEDLCAGSTPERHKMAIEIMKSCLIDVRRFN